MDDLYETDYLISKVLQYKKLHPPVYYEYEFNKDHDFGLIKRVFIKYKTRIGILYEDFMFTNKNTIIGPKYLYRSKEQLSVIRQKCSERLINKKIKKKCIFQYKF